nr:MAG TPA: hypothetical protein [Caudoviricetes sp.]
MHHKLITNFSVLLYLHFVFHHHKLDSCITKLLYCKRIFVNS